MRESGLYTGCGILLSRTFLVGASRLPDRDPGRKSGCATRAAKSTRTTNKVTDETAISVPEKGSACNFDAEDTQTDRVSEEPGCGRWPKSVGLWITWLPARGERRIFDIPALRNYYFSVLLRFSKPLCSRKFRFYDKLGKIRIFERQVAATIVSAAVLLGTAQDAGAMDLPSGLQAELHEVLVDQIGSENWVRFRFLAPAIDRALPGAPGFADLERDFPHLCAALAVPYLAAHALEADKVVISIADRIIEFGVSDPESTQYFEQFRIDDGTCIWEAF